MAADVCERDDQDGVGEPAAVLAQVVPHVVADMADGTAAMVVAAHGYSLLDRSRSTVVGPARLPAGPKVARLMTSGRCAQRVPRATLGTPADGQ